MLIDLCDTQNANTKCTFQYGRINFLIYLAVKPFIRVEYYFHTKGGKGENKSLSLNDGQRTRLTASAGENGEMVPGCCYCRSRSVIRFVVTILGF